MIHTAAKIFSVVGAVGTMACLAFYGLCLGGAVAFLRRRRGARIRPAQPMPPVSILKPLKGADPEMYENFRSHFVQEYENYEIIFGVSDRNDPAVRVAQRLQQEFSQPAVRLVVCEENLGVNTKVSNLAQMLRQARHEYIVVNDSDIRAGQDYLRTVISPLLMEQAPRVGLVTCLYRGIAAPTLASRLESLGISTDFAAGVLAARELERGLRFGLGSTLAFRRSDLEEIGGFEAFADYLADDYQLGHRLAGRGLAVELSDTVVETYLPRYSIAQLVSHQLRWARTVRGSRPGGYAGLLLTFGVPWALITLACSGGNGWAWGLLTTTIAVRIALALTVGLSVLQDRQVPALLPLLLLRDLLAPLVWLGGLFGNTIVWRGEKFTLRNGRLTRS